jgi:hypothetical protein
VEILVEIELGADHVMYIHCRRDAVKQAGPMCHFEDTICSQSGIGPMRLSRQNIAIT